MATVYRVYVIKNLQGRFFIGVSDDVPRSVEEHNDGISSWTKGKGPWAVVWTSDAKSLPDARRFEILLKKQNGGAGFYHLTGLSRPADS